MTWTPVINGFTVTMATLRIKKMDREHRIHVAYYPATFTLLSVLLVLGFGIISSVTVV
jgi:type VI protein secretion system component VasA